MIARAARRAPPALGRTRRRRRGRRVPAPARGRSSRRRWPLLLALCVLALLAWMWWPSDPPATSADAANTASAAVVARAAATPASDQPPAPVAPPKTRHATPPPKPKAPEPPPLVRARRDLLLAAVRARSPSLRPCVPADATEVRIPVRLHVLRNGPVKGVELAGAAVAREISDCVRRVATSWNFADVELPSDVELFATLALTAGT